MAQWFATAAGQRYGPVGEDVIRKWAQEGRIGPADMVWCEGMAQWAPASQIPGLLPASIAPATIPGVPPVPGQFPAVAQWTRPHRGGTVLAMGILGLACCFIFGIVAWVMGNSDLRDMDSGTMDPSGRGTTSAGKVCGIISVVLMIIGMVVGILGGLAGIGFPHHSHRF